MTLKELDQLDLYELILQDEEDGVYSNSLVSAPAIERDFIFFNKEIVNLQSVDDEKRLVAGPLLIPNKKILRADFEGKPYAIFFSEKTIEEMSRKFMKNKLNNEMTIEHGNSKVKGVYLTESWLIDQSAKDKSNSYGFTLPRGTWFGVYKVENDEIWNKIKSGEVKGFSVEMIAEHIEAKSKPKNLFSKQISDLDETEAKNLLELIHSLLMPDTELEGVQPSINSTYPGEVSKKKKDKLESYSDYGVSIRNNAKRGIELNDKVNNKCATQVGKVRAQQLANGEGISLDTIKRMYSYLSRAETYYDESDTTACGTISYLLWGGKSALSWSRNKLRELGELELKVGVPHYTADGQLYEGPTHKDADGRLMTGEVHTEDSEYLYHKEELPK
jgi:hypothetical protein